MTVTQSWRTAEVRPAAGPASEVSGGRRRYHRAGVRLWALLNAQALLDGTAGTADGGLLSEDDRWRLAARRAN
jgi:hypothetical protein